MIDLKDHSYKDVLNTPVKDMISTIANEDSIPSWLVNNKPLWLCEMNEEGEGDGSSSEDYIPEPFLEHELEPYGWHDILATFGCMRLRPCYKTL